MSPQLDYNDQDNIPAVKGGLADTAFHDIVGRRAAVDIGFGLGLIKTVTEGLVALPAATGFKLAGIAIQTLKDIPRATGIALHEIDSEFPVIKKGRVWVYSEVAVTPLEPVFMRHTTTTTELPGDFRNDADTARADDISAVAAWVSTTTGAGLALLEINIP